jgi:2-iminobutanoate/2-iminopropanoate deaminase
VQVLKNIEAILLSENIHFEHVVKCEVYLKNINDFQALNKIYAAHFNGAVKPARQTMEVSALPLNALIEISCIAYLEK